MCCVVCWCNRCSVADGRILPQLLPFLHNFTFFLLSHVDHKYRQTMAFCSKPCKARKSRSALVASSLSTGLRLPLYVVVHTSPQRNPSAPEHMAAALSATSGPEAQRFVCPLRKPPAGSSLSRTGMQNTGARCARASPIGPHAASSTRFGVRWGMQGTQGRAARRWANGVWTRCLSAAVTRSRLIQGFSAL